MKKLQSKLLIVLFFVLTVLTPAFFCNDDGGGNSGDWEIQPRRSCSGSDCPDGPTLKPDK
jgi:hypothetical protein